MIKATAILDLGGLDLQAIITASEDMGKRNSGKLAGQVRLTSKRSMKKASRLSARRLASGGNHSLPGEPPLEKTGAIKNFLKYAWDEEKREYVIGPERLSKLGLQANSLELGKPTLINARDDKGNRKIVKVPMLARPFMKPALDKIMNPANIKKVYEKSLKPRRGF